MSQAKVALREHRKKGVPVLGAAGLSLWLGGGAPSAMGVATPDMATCSVAVNHEQTLREEEIADITLSTFQIFDRERTPRLITRIAGACGACGSGFYEQPANNGPARSISPPARRPERPSVQTLKRTPERPQERPAISTRHQDQNASRTHREAGAQTTNQNASRAQREAGARTTNQNATPQAQPELDGLVVNQSAGQQAQPQIAAPATNFGN
jgi:hypothetical protein